MGGEDGVETGSLSAIHQLSLAVLNIWDATPEDNSGGFEVSVRDGDHPNHPGAKTISINPQGFFSVDESEKILVEE